MDYVSCELEKYLGFGVRDLWRDQQTCLSTFQSLLVFEKQMVIRLPFCFSMVETIYFIGRRGRGELLRKTQDAQAFLTLQVIIHPLNFS